MNTETTINLLHKLVEEYHNHTLSTADYRFRRRQLLIEVDVKINGFAPKTQTSSDLITLRKFT